MKEVKKQKRNSLIYIAYFNGWEIADLADIFNLSKSTIRSIVYAEQKIHQEFPEFKLKLYLPPEQWDDQTTTFEHKGYKYKITVNRVYECMQAQGESKGEEE